MFGTFLISLLLLPIVSRATATVDPPRPLRDPSADEPPFVRTSALDGAAP